MRGWKMRARSAAAGGRSGASGSLAVGRRHAPGTERARQRAIQADRACTRSLCEAEGQFRRLPWKTFSSSARPALRSGKFGGSLAKMPASDLGALVIRKVLERAGGRAGTGFRGHLGPGADRRDRAEPRRGRPPSAPACRT